ELAGVPRARRQRRARGSACLGARADRAGDRGGGLAGARRARVDRAGRLDAASGQLSWAGLRGECNAIVLNATALSGSAGTVGLCQLTGNTSTTYRAWASAMSGDAHRDCRANPIG